MGVFKTADGRSLVGIGQQDGNEYSGFAGWRDCVIQLTASGATENSVKYLNAIKDYAIAHNAKGESIMPPNLSVWISNNGVTTAVQADDIAVDGSNVTICGIKWDGTAWDYTDAGKCGGSGGEGIPVIQAKYTTDSDGVTPHYYAEVDDSLKALLLAPVPFVWCQNGESYLCILAAPRPAQSEQSVVVIGQNDIYRTGITFNNGIAKFKNDTHFGTDYTLTYSKPSMEGDVFVSERETYYGQSKIVGKWKSDSQLTIPCQVVSEVDSSMAAQFEALIDNLKTASKAASDHKSAMFLPFTGDMDTVFANTVGAFIARKIPTIKLGNRRVAITDHTLAGGGSTYWATGSWTDFVLDSMTVDCFRCSVSLARVSSALAGYVISVEYVAAPVFTG